VVSCRVAVERYHVAGVSLGVAEGIPGFAKVSYRVAEANYYLAHGVSPDAAQQGTPVGPEESLDGVQEGSPGVG
jgi:hypothetical protein